MRNILLMILASAGSLFGPAHADAQTQRKAIETSSGDAPLHYVSIGKPEVVPIVAVNGGPGFDHRYLIAAPIWQDMAERRQIIFYDQRGTGESPGAAGGELSVSGMVEDLEALRRHLKIERMDLIGHSWGGILSMAYATRYPGHVAHLVLVGSGDARLTSHEYLFDKLYPDITATIPADNSLAAQMGCVAIDAYDRMSYYDQRNLVQATGPDAPRFSQDTCTTVMVDAMKLDLYPELAKLDVPTLVINGRFDANVAPTVAWRISHAIPGAKLAYFERSGHSPFVEEPEKFALVVEHFLADDGDKGAGAR